MRYKSNKAISLAEVLIAVTVIATALTVVFRSFGTAIFASRLSQDITLASLVAESGLWEIEQKYPLIMPSLDIYPLEQFKCDYKITDTVTENLKKLDFNVSWQAKKNKKYNIMFSTYLLSKNDTP